MATSSSTLLQVANAVLLAVNEREVAALNTQQGQQLKNCIRMTVKQLQEESDWPWLTAQLNGTWTGNLVTFSNTSRIKSVFWQNVVGSTSHNIYIRAVDRLTFDGIALSSYSSAGRPRYWCIEEHNSIRVVPYPTVLVEQNKIFANVSLTIPMPVGDNDTFNIPETYMELVKLLATGLYALQHLDDKETYGIYLGLYQQHLSSYRSRHYNSPGQAMNLYRRSGYGRV